jgi:tellurite resistance protein
MVDILDMDDGLVDEAAFVAVDALSQANDALYRTWVQPWIRTLVTPWTAEGLRQLHPLRFQRYAWSDANPFVWPFALWSPLVKPNRRPVSPDNPFVQAEAYFSDAVTAALNLYRDTRDSMQEWLFKSIFENPWTAFWWGSGKGPQVKERSQEQTERLRRQEAAYAKRQANRGGFSEAVIRIIIAVSGVNRVLDKRQIEAAEAIVRPHKAFQHFSPEALKQMVRDQARILSANRELALAGLASILRTQAQREEAFDIALKMAVADKRVDLEERSLLTQIRRILQLHHDDLYA